MRCRQWSLTGGRLTITLETVTAGDRKQLTAGEYALIRFADTGQGYG